MSTIKFEGLDKLKTYMRDIGLNADKVMQKVINENLTAIRDISDEEVRKELNINKRYSKSTFTIKKATAKGRPASVKTKDRPLAFHASTGIRFGGRALKKGYSFQIKKTKQRIQFKKAFKMNLKTGHIGIFIRIKKAVAGKGGLKELYTTRVPDILDNVKNIDFVLRESADLLEKEAKIKIDELIKK